ncbi:glycosyltransferase family protein [Schleiferiaceae bacterium]|nr:glycosyltransferase family protein [Schleiferiaceae bacterium]
MKVLLITQARIGSTRLPGKVLLPIGEETLLSIHLKRLRNCTTIDQIVVATTFEDGVESLIDICRESKVDFYQGSLDDVLDRFYQASIEYHPDWVVRVTSDCPLLDSRVVDQVVQEAIESDVDYCANIITEDFPDGQDVEVFKFSALELAWKEASLKSEREHVTPYIRNNSDRNGGELFKAHDVKCHSNFNSIRMTVDEEADLIAIQRLIRDLGIRSTWEEYADYILKHSESIGNTNIIRNEGYQKSLIKDK